MMSAFQKIGLMGQYKTQEGNQTLHTLIDYLQKKTLDVYVESETAASLNANDVQIINKDQLGETVDLVIAVGGDGTLLQAARCIVDNGIPVVGINHGRLGFLTDICAKDLEEKLDDIFAKTFFIEKRFLLQAEVEGQSLPPCAALNDVVIASGDAAHMMEFEVYINQNFMCSERSNGMIFATPTGSTAYALSGGGPIIQPTLDAILLVPMFSHSLSSRPIVVPGNSEITLVIGERIVSPPRISADGLAICELAAGQQVHIKKKTNALNLLHPVDYDYFGNVRSKLHWGHKLTRSDEASC
jgi:NAD+ kinase